MDAFQTQFIFLTELILIPLSIALISIGILGFRYRTPKTSIPAKTGYSVSLLMGLLLVFFAAKILLSAPSFDFIERCRPPGTGFCIDGRSYDLVMYELRLDQAKAVMIFVISPVLAFSILVQLFASFFNCAVYHKQ